VIPSIILAGVNAYRLWTEHWEHVAHGPALEDKPEYPFQNIRTKNYFWGDGDKVRTFDPYRAAQCPASHDC
jgi:cytochrome c oxidase subunit 6a